MKHFIMALVLALLCGTTLMANDKKIIEETAKSFIIKNNSMDESVKDLMTDDFIDKSDDDEKITKEKFMKKMEEKKKEHDRVMDLLKITTYRRFLNEYYANNPKMLK